MQQLTPTHSLGLPLPGTWETLVLLALAAAAASALLFCADAAARRRSPMPGNAARPWLSHAAACALLGLAGLAVGPGKTLTAPVVLRFRAADWSAEGMLCAGALLLCALIGLWRCRRADIRPGWGIVLPSALAAAATLASLPQALRLCLMQPGSLPPLWPLHLALAGLAAACGMAALRQEAASPLSLDAARLRVLCGIAALACALAGVLVTPAAAAPALGWRIPEYAATACAMAALFCWRWPRLAPLCGVMAILAGLLLLWKVLFLQQAVTAATDAAQQMTLALRLFRPEHLPASLAGVVFCAVCVFLLERLAAAPRDVAEKP